MKKENSIETENHVDITQHLNLKEQAKQNEEVFEISSTGYGLESVKEDER